jgi:hypothetical protein
MYTNTIEYITKCSKLRSIQKTQTISEQNVSDINYIWKSHEDINSYHFHTFSIWQNTLTSLSQWRWKGISGQEEYGITLTKQEMMILDYLYTRRYTTASSKQCLRNWYEKLKI